MDVQSTDPYNDEVDPQRLLVDTQNPRLPDDGLGQREATLRLAEYQGSKLLSLCDHIATYGLNPAQRFIVIPGDGGDFIVLDGNRRLVALKALDTPSTFPHLKPNQLKRLKEMGSRAVLPRTVPVVVFHDRVQAEPWIRLTHLNQRGGVGQSRWSAQQKARHEERLGTKPMPLQVLDFARRNGMLSDKTVGLIDQGAFPVTTIERMLESTDAKALLGIETRDGVVWTSFPPEQVARGLSRFVDDLGTGRRDTRSLNTAKQRLDYVRGFPVEDLPDPGARKSELVPLDEITSAATLSSSPTARRRDRKTTAIRTYLIPAGTLLDIPPGKIHDIYLELKSKVRVDDTPHAAGALMRMLLELGLVAYCAREKLPGKSTDHLRENLNLVGEHLLKTSRIAKKSLDGVRASIIESNTGYTTVQAIMHNPDFPVTGSELRRVWDRVQPIFVAMWPGSTQA